MGGIACILSALCCLFFFVAKDRKKGASVEAMLTPVLFYVDCTAISIGAFLLVGFFFSNATVQANFAFVTARDFTRDIINALERQNLDGDLRFLSLSSHPSSLLTISETNQKFSRVSHSIENHEIRKVH